MLETILQLLDRFTARLSELYVQFLSLLFNLYSSATPSRNIKEAWTKDIGVAISENLWVKGLSGIMLCSVNA